MIHPSVALAWTKSPKDIRNVFLWLISTNHYLIKRNVIYLMQKKKKETLIKKTQDFPPTALHGSLVAWQESSCLFIHGTLLLLTEGIKPWEDGGTVGKPSSDSTHTSTGQ